MGVVKLRLQLFSAANIYFFCLTAFSASNTRFFHLKYFFRMMAGFFHLKFSCPRKCAFQNLTDGFQNYVCRIKNYLLNVKICYLLNLRLESWPWQ